MHPLTILAAFMGMLIQATPGGKGVGLMYMIMFIIITVFVVGLMSGRTPEYLGIKITARDVKLVMVAFLVHPLIILVPTFLAFASGAAAQIGASAQLHRLHSGPLRVHHGGSQQRLRLLRCYRQHPLLQHLHCDCDLPRPLRADRNTSRPGRLHDRKEAKPGGRPEDGQRHLLRRPGREHPDPRRPHFLPLPRARPHSAVLPRTGEQPWLANASRNAESAGSVASSPARVLRDSLVRLSPVSLSSNPVMLIVELTFFIVAAMAIDPSGLRPALQPSDDRSFYVEVAAILLITVWFSTLSDALAEQQARNTASSLRRLESEVLSKKVVSEQWSEKVIPTPSSAAPQGRPDPAGEGDLVPDDAEVLEGIAMVDESLMTGESAPVRKAPGDVLIGGSTLVSDTLTARVTVNPEDSYINKMIKMVEAAKRPKTPNEQAVTMVLIGLTAIFTIIIAALAGPLRRAQSRRGPLGHDRTLRLPPADDDWRAPPVDRALRDVQALQEDGSWRNRGRPSRLRATQTSSCSTRRARSRSGTGRPPSSCPSNGHSAKEVGEAAFLSSWYDDTPEGRSIIRLAYESGTIPRELNSLALESVSEFSATTQDQRREVLCKRCIRSAQGGQQARAEGEEQQEALRRDQGQRIGRRD